MQPILPARSALRLTILSMLLLKHAKSATRTAATARRPLPPALLAPWLILTGTSRVQIPPAGSVMRATTLTPPRSVRHALQ